MNNKLGGDITRRYVVDTLDVSGLPKKKVDELQKIIDQYREEVHKVQNLEKDPKDDVVFTTQKSSVIGSLTRREIYEHL